MTQEIATQEAKLKSHTELQERMKLVNKAYDAYKKNPGKLAQFELTQAEIAMIQRYVPKNYGAGKVYQSWELTNNNAVISSTKKRIDELTKRAMEAEAAAGENKEIPFQGGTVIYNYDDDRVQIDFDSKPEPAMIEKLKQHGFKWTPSASVWQRQLTDRAKHDTNYILKIGQWSPEAVKEWEENQKADREAGAAQWVITPQRPVNILSL